MRAVINHTEQYNYYSNNIDNLNVLIAALTLLLGQEAHFVIAHFNNIMSWNSASLQHIYYRWKAAGLDWVCTGRRLHSGVEACS